MSDPRTPPTPQPVRYTKMGIEVRGNEVIFTELTPNTQGFDLDTPETRRMLRNFLLNTHSDGDLADLAIGLMDLIRVQQAKIKELKG